MGITVRVHSRVPAVSAQIMGQVERATKKAALDIEGYAKAGAPVRTGHLRGAIQAEGRGLDWRVHSHANYSIYQEFGTRFMAAHPYLIPALERVRPSFLAALKLIGRK